MYIGHSTRITYANAVSKPKYQTTANNIVRLIWCVRCGFKTLRCTLHSAIARIESISTTIHKHTNHAANTTQLTFNTNSNELSNQNEKRHETQKPTHPTGTMELTVSQNSMQISEWTWRSLHELGSIWWPFLHSNWCYENSRLFFLFKWTFLSRRFNDNFSNEIFSRLFLNCLNF